MHSNEDDCFAMQCDATYFFSFSVWMQTKTGCHRASPGNCGLGRSDHGAERPDSLKVIVSWHLPHARIMLIHYLIIFFWIMDLSREGVPPMPGLYEFMGFWNSFPTAFFWLIMPWFCGKSKWQRAPLFCRMYELSQVKPLTLFWNFDFTGTSVDLMQDMEADMELLRAWDPSWWVSSHIFYS